MNNEPVAWMDEINTFVLDKDYKQFPKSLQNGMIPLYTHPANPYQSITDTKIEPTVVSYTHPVKELTDEEIYACFHQYFVLGEPKPTHFELEYEDLIDFANAILRKAQEK